MPRWPKIIAGVAWAGCALAAQAQVLFDGGFADGNYTQNPAWSGTTSLFRIEGQALRYQGPAATTTAYLSAPFARNLNAGTTEWTLELALLGTKLDHLNWIRVYLTADLPDLLAGPFGYYLRLGGGVAGSDGTVVRLIRASAGGEFEVLASASGTVAAPGTYRLRVARSATGVWDLSQQTTPGGPYLPLATGFDLAPSTSDHTGVATRHQGDNPEGFRLLSYQVVQPGPDVAPPSLLSVDTPAPDSVLLTFSEALPAAAAQPDRYRIDGILAPVAGNLAPGNSTQVRLALPLALADGQTYTLSYTDVPDLAGNLGSGALGFTYRAPAALVPGTLVVNEILFDPLPDQVRYVELRNTTGQPINLRGLELWRGTREGVGVSAVNRTLPPYGVVCLASDTAQVRAQYLPPDSARFLLLPGLPLVGREGDTLRLLSAAGVTLDSVIYSPEWHSAWVADSRGVALERRSGTGTATAATTWASAASTVGYGTPGYANSQLDPVLATGGTFRLLRRAFSPRGDGLTDKLELELHYPDYGWQTEWAIYTPQGQEVRRFAPLLLPTHPVLLVWDGRSSRGDYLPPGFYILLLEVRHTDGRHDRHRAACVVAPSG